VEPNSKQALQSDDAGLSLDELSRAFAAMLGPDNASALPQPMPAVGGMKDEPGTSNAFSAPASTAYGEKPSVPSLRCVVEAVLFTGRPDNVPIPSQDISSLLCGVSPQEVEQQIQELNSQYALNRCPYVIVAEDAGFRLSLRPEHAPLRSRIHGKIRATRLSPAAIEVLALVAYNEPVTADQIARFRGTPSGHVLSYLVRRKLLRLERSDTRPRKTSYFTTKKFLDLFHLRSLQDLPRSDDLAKQ
jgi:segregation and condensation protein B